MRVRYKDRMLQAMYAGCIDAARNNRSEMYIAKLTSGQIYGPAMPRRGAGHRCAFWDGFYGIASLYSRDPGTLGHAAFRAGQDFRLALPQKEQ